jgi:hypothetical protein
MGKMKDQKADKINLKDYYQVILCEIQKVAISKSNT